ncbi:hypothetical protein JTB14_006740 [Gonioctena quinquepunctata]|nr:hypothetical protein JTB14_006740 [Gonioctena quinquepunctata]
MDEKKPIMNTDAEQVKSTMFFHKTSYKDDSFKSVDLKETEPAKTRSRKSAEDGFSNISPKRAYDNKIGISEAKK